MQNKYSQKTKINKYLYLYVYIGNIKYQIYDTIQSVLIILSY